MQKLKQSLAATLLALAVAPMAMSAQISPKDAQQIAVDAYIYGYSLITTEVTRVQMSNVSAVEALKAPMGQFVNIKRYPPADYRGVSAPNADTLYSVSWLDLSEPQVLSHPDMGKRFHLFELTDLWMIDSDKSPSPRVADGKAANYLFTGPGWKGAVPKGMKHIPMSTRYMAILGRTYANGTDADYEAVNALQAQYKVTPLSAWGKPYTPVAPAVNPAPGFSMSEPPQNVINAMDTASYFNMMATLMCKSAPPAAEDRAIVAKMATIGVVPCKPFDMSKFDADTQALLKDVNPVAMKQIEGAKASLGKVVNGWVVSKGLGHYGTDYLKRAVVAAFGWPANRQEDAVYPYAIADANGDKLSGTNKYTLTFAKGQTPPINAFWSITMYLVDQGWWFVPNPLNKFTVSPRNNLKYNADGSLTLYFQHESPGKDKEPNWLPAPKGEFIPMLRMYWPKAKGMSIIDGSWAPPVVKKTQ